MSSRLEILITNGALAGQRFTVPPAGLRLGRSSSNDVHVPDEELSRNHCLFEQKGDIIAVTDLASANGTYVNGTALGAEARELAAGDRIAVGGLVLRIVKEGEEAPSPAGPVDLGLGAEKASVAEAGAPPPLKRRTLVNLLWAACVLVIGAAIGVVLLVPQKSGEASGDRSVRALANTAAAPDPILAVSYEKVEADARRIFRYQMTIDADGLLNVVYDDVPGENRHVNKTGRLGEKALERIREIFQTPGWSDLEGTYTGPSAAGENALKSWTIRTVIGKSVRRVHVENTTEPEAFAAVRDALEAFSQNELGIWALQYSRDQLIALSAESVRVGDAKSAERDVEYGNLSAAVKAYKEAIFYLDTVNPKPNDYAALRAKLASVQDELARRYKDQRFLADKAINLADWETARTELRTLCDLVPEKDDPRHDEANAKLVDVENRLRRAKKGGKKK